MKLTAACLAGCWLLAVAVRGQSPVAVTVETGRPGPDIPGDFSGFSFETTSELPNVNRVKGYMFDPGNAPFLALIRELGIKCIRFGGGTVDWTPHPIPGPADIDRVFAFARAAGIEIIYSFRLQNGDKAADAALARYIWDHHRAELLCFAIGNEVDWHAYHTYPGHPRDPRIYETVPGDPGSAYPSFLAQWREFAAAIERAAPGAKFEGPSTGSNYPVPGAKNTDYQGRSWTANFARDEKGSGLVSFVAQHNYVGQSAPGHTPAQMIEEMLSPRWVSECYPALYQVTGPPAAAAGFGFRLMESNSYSGIVAGGSNSCATALFALDYLQWWAAHGCLGVNFHNKQWQENDTIYLDAAGRYQVYPMAYGIKAFALGGHGRVEPVKLASPESLNLTAYAARDGGTLFVTVINKEHGARARTAALSLATPGFAGPASAMFLLLPHGDVAATDGLTLGGDVIDSGRPWRGRWTSVTPGKLRLPPASAVVVRIEAP